MRSNCKFGQSDVIINGKLLIGNTVNDKPLGRTKQIAQIQRCLNLSLVGHPPMNVWIYGPPGSGKTMITRWLMNSTCSSHNSMLGIYINCWQHRSLYSVLQAIIDNLRILNAELQDTNIKLDRIERTLRGKSAVFILDEIDRVMPSQRDSIIYCLLSLPQAGLICVANTTQTLATLEKRVQSRLCPVMIEFPAYTVDQVQEILTDRANQALAQGSWSPLIIKRIADAVGGDSRMAIQILRQAAVIAEEKGRDKLNVRSVNRILHQWQNIRHEARIVSLTEHEKIVYKLVKQNGSVGTTKLTTLYIAYCHRHKIQPMARRTFSKYLNRLVTAGIVSFAVKPVSPGGRIIKIA